MEECEPYEVRVISDTHGLLRPEAVRLLRGARVIIHAGDVGTRDVLDAIRPLSARVIAVRGNVDHGPWTEALPMNELIEVAGRLLYVLHDLNTLDINPAAEGIDVVISGHSHRPLAERRGGVLFLNPGSAGPRRFRLPICMASLRVPPMPAPIEWRWHQLAI